MLVLLCLSLLMIPLFTVQKEEEIASDVPQVTHHVTLELEPNCQGKSLSRHLPRHFEPSDITVRSSDSSLFIVSDTGHLAQMDSLGRVMQTSRISKEDDYEGITLNSKHQDLVYLGNEYPATIIEFNLTTWQVQKEWKVQSYLDETPLSQISTKNLKNAGLESLLFVPSSLKSQGFIYLGRQADAMVFSFEFIDGDLKFKGRIQPPGPGYDLSAMTLYDGKVWFLYDKPGQLVSLPLDTFHFNSSDDAFYKDFSQNTSVDVFQTEVRGMEGIAFIEEDNKTKVIVAIDPPKHKGKKDILKFDLHDFERCFKVN